MSNELPRRLSTGVSGLDEVVGGGFFEGRGYLLYGAAGAGKTVFGLHFLDAGVAAGETALFINLEEDVDDLRRNAAALGFDVDAIDFLDLSPGAEVFVEDRSYEVFPASEVEAEPVTERIVERVREVEPDRVVVDPITQFRYLTESDYAFRKQVVGFARFLKRQDATVVFTAQDAESHTTADLQFLSDGTVLLETGEGRRRVTVPKFRGTDVQVGPHAFRITDRGAEVYPALDPGATERVSVDGQISSGVPEVDSLLHGGLERGTVTILSGPTGAGKTTLGTQFMKEAAGRGERSVVYLFEETMDTFVRRSTAVNIPVREMMDRGTLQVEEVEAIDVSPEEFARMVRRDVQENDADIVMIDGIAGYRLTLTDTEIGPTEQIHRLGRFLKNSGVTTILVDETRDVTGGFHATGENISYLADNLVFLRHIELEGELRKAIGVLKKRTSDYERALREFRITEHGITVGEPLSRLRGVLTGTPTLVDEE